MTSGADFGVTLVRFLYFFLFLSFSSFIVAVTCRSHGSPWRSL